MIFVALVVVMVALLAYAAPAPLEVIAVVLRHHRLFLRGGNRTQVEPQHQAERGTAAAQERR
jgi:hypothetical protein